MNRISVVGCTGSGKTTMARSLAESFDIPHLEFDSVYHQPDWTPLPDDEFLSTVDAFTSGDRWVVDGNYNSPGVLDLAWSRADTVVWLDPPKRVVMSQVSRRTLKRGARRQELWNGNRESLRSLMKWDPEENIIRWAWTRFEPMRARHESRTTDPRWSHLNIFHLRTRNEAAEFLEIVDSR
jgi:adenylate kinase family enzyme